MKKLLTFLLTLTMAFGAATMVACGGNGENSETGSSVVEQAKYATVNFSVKDQDALAVANVQVTFTDENEQSVSATCDENGCFTLTLKTGSYSISYLNDYELLGGYYLPETKSVSITEYTTAMQLLMTNNTPNGTLDRAFSLSVGENEIIIPANTAYYYRVYRAVNLYVSINSQNVSLDYKGTAYTADEDGNISVALLGTNTNSVETFLITNLTDSEQTVNVNVGSAPGTQSNPLALSLDKDVTTKLLVAKEDLYYTYTATAAGTLTIELKSASSYVSMTNASNSINVNSADDEDEDGIVSLALEEGDEVIIIFGLTYTGEETASVIFNATFAGELQ